MHSELFFFCMIFSSKELSGASPAISFSNNRTAVFLVLISECPGAPRRTPRLAKSAVLSLAASHTTIPLLLLPAPRLLSPHSLPRTPIIPGNPAPARRIFLRGVPAHLHDRVFLSTSSLQGLPRNVSHLLIELLQSLRLLSERLLQGIHVLSTACLSGARVLVPRSAVVIC